jgi:hypothetical protein
VVVTGKVKYLRREDGYLTDTFKVGLDVKEVMRSRHTWIFAITEGRIGPIKP